MFGRKEGKEETAPYPAPGGLRGFAGEVTRDIFVVSLSLYLVLSMIDTTWKGSVSFFFNVNLVLYAALFSGTLVLLKGDALEGRVWITGSPRASPVPRHAAILATGSAVFLLLVLATADFGRSHYLVSVALGGAVVVFAYALLGGRDPGRKVR